MKFDKCKEFGIIKNLFRQPENQKKIKYQYSCNVCLLLSGDIMVQSYDVIDPNSFADWGSLRMVRLSREVIDLCLVDCIKKLLYSKKIITPSEIDPKMLNKMIPQFCGFPSYKKLDEHSKLLYINANEDGDIQLLPTQYEKNAGFAHLNDLSIYASIGDDDLIAKIRQAFDLCVGSFKWEYC